jgi:hypothetical protein
MADEQKPKIGVYVEVVMHGHGAHEIIGAWDVPVEKVEELQTVIESRPDLFSIRAS